MVYLSNTAINDLESILIGLMTWAKRPLSLEHAEKYVDDISNICYTLDTKPWHADTIYAIHKQYGTQVHTYKRNQRTMWYIIYNLDMYNNIYVQKIISNYQTH